MSAPDGSIGRHGFVEQHGLWSAQEHQRAREVVQQVQRDGLEVVRLSFPDQHGILRGKTILAADLAKVMSSGCGMASSLLLKDTSHRTVFPIWEAGAGGLGDFVGAGDVLMVPDPATFRVLPWSPHTGWLLCDLYFADGRPVPFATRTLCRNALTQLGEHGYDYMCGLEVEFHVFKLDDPKLQPRDAGQPGAAPAVSLLAQGCQFLTETRYDELETVMDIVRRCAQALDLPVRSFEVEFGPSQFEVTFHPAAGIAHADNMVLFRSAVKQVCRRNGYHATFMCRPALPNLFSSGWHLHQSLVQRSSGANAFTPADAGAALAPVGMQFIAGLLEHAQASCLFAAPTINAYKRYAARSLAPDRVLWGRDNRGAMLRVIGGPGDPATRVENRIGEPAANPYLYLASQIHAGLDGIERALQPPPAVDTPYDSNAPGLPKSLLAAVECTAASAFYRRAFGAPFMDYLLTIKRAEIDRYLADIGEWEQREYFATF